MKTILITGGAGFVGSNLCARLLSDGNRIICVDNFSSSSKENVVSLLVNKNFKLIEHDIINPLIVDENIDEIFNLACPASPVHYQNNAIRTIKTNTIGVMNILDLAVAKNAKILQASTSEVYGDPLVHPQKETYYGNVNPIGPRACYDEGKRCAETLFFDYFRIHHLKIKVIRIFNTYGQNMASDDGRVISNFITQALRGEDITIYGDGNQTRSFCFVDDLIDGIIKIMNSDNNIFGPINLGNPDEITINELAHKIIKMVDSNSRIIYKNLPADDPIRRCPNTVLANNIINWKPKVKLSDGLFRTIEYFKDKLC